MSQPALTIEPIGTSNAMVFKAIRLAALLESPSAFGSTYAKECQFSDADWLKRATVWSSDRSIGYLALSAGKACGIIAGFIDEHDARKVQLISMWVAPGYRRSGIGGSLIDAALAWACERGVQTANLMVTSINAPAIRFYERCGFAITGNTEPYPNDPGLLEYEMSRSTLPRVQ